MAPRVFIDGAAGTTGLEIRSRLAARDDIHLVELADARRKDARARADALNSADLVILCLPDEAAREAAALIENPSVRVIDASTAHRTAPGWVYGFPEMDAAQRDMIRIARRVTNPGCYPTGAIALLRPLTRAGLVAGDFPITVTAVSGYSGGGKAMIAEFENREAPEYVETVVRTYALTLDHKHVEEMRVHCGLARAPLFAPSVGRFYRGMIVEVPLQTWALPARPTAHAIRTVLKEHYAGETFVTVVDENEGGALKTLDAELLRHTNSLKLFVFGNDRREQVRLVAVLDNLGKGASGAAVQNLNLMLGFDEGLGLKAA